MAGVDVATGMTLTFVTSAWAPNVISTTPPPLSRPTVDLTHLATAGGRSTRSGELYEIGEATAVVQHDADDPAPYSAVDEVIRWTYALNTGESTASKEEATGRIVNYQRNEATVDGLLTATVTMSFTDEWTQTDST